MAGPGNILIKVGADTGQAVKELSTLNTSLGSTMTTSQKMGAGMRKAALPAAAALGLIAAGAASATKAAAEDAAAQEHLAGVLERVTGASDAQVSANEDWIASISRATGVADDELRPAMEKLATATGSVSEAQKLMKQALDISAASGKPVETVAVAIAKAHSGQTAALAKLVPGLHEATIKSKDFTTIMGELQEKTGGASAEAAGTAAGQFKILNNQMGELQETLGAALLPVVERLAPILVHMADIAADNTGAIEVLVGVVSGLAAGILVINGIMKAYSAVMTVVKVATETWTVVQKLLNISLKDNPIGLVITAVGLLVAALVIAYKKSETFRDIVDGALSVVKDTAQALAAGFTAIWKAAQTAFNWVVSHWQLALFAFGPIGAAIYLITTNFDKLKAAAKDAGNFVIGIFNGIKGAIDNVISAITTLIDWISKIPTHISLPHIPGIPFTAAAPAPSPAFAGTAARASSRSSSSGSGITVNVFGAVDPEGTARTVKRILAAHERRMGRA